MLTKMLTKRKLLAWRREALKKDQQLKAQSPTTFDAISPLRVATDRILALTQELIDQHLLIEKDD